MCQVAVTLTCAPPELRPALAAITQHVDDHANRARLPRAA